MKYQDDEIKDMYERNIDMLYKIAYTYFKGDKYKIEDAIQDLFLKVINKNIRFESINHEKYYFIVAIKNICKNELKRKWNQDVELDFDVEDEVKEDSIIDKVLNLPEKYKLPIYLFYYEGYSALEIAKILNTKENTIYSYLNRGRNLLKIELEDNYEEK